MTVFVPTTIDDALGALSAHPDADVLAGGTDLMVEVNEGRHRPTAVVAVHRIPELRSWTYDPSARTVRLGAAVTYHEVLEEPLSTLLPALAQAARTVGSPQIRHAATVGGNLATASPAGDGLPVFAAAEAVVHLVSAVGRRDVPFVEFITGPKRTVLRRGELIEAITVPVLDGWQGYSKIGVRNAMVIAVASVCLAVHDGGLRVALGSVGPTILRCPEAEAFAAAQADLGGGRVDDATVRAFGEMVSAASRPIDDHRATAAYRRHAVGVLARRLLRRACPDE